ncbi:hypothetical protein Tco_1509689 [Tanacetum coccineum]
MRTTIFNTHEPSTLDVRYMLKRSHWRNGIVELYFIRAEYQLADIFTKPLPRDRFNFLIEKLDVPEVYMHQFWDSVYKHDTFYRFKMDKRKRFKLTLEIFRDIFKICPRVQGQDFDALLTDEEIVSFLRELGHSREINSLNDVIVDQMHQPWRTFAALINRSLSGKTTSLDKLCLSRAKILWGATPPNKARKFKKPASPKLSTVPVSSEEPIKKSKRVKRSKNKPTKALAGGVVIRETLEMPLSKKKEKVDVARGKGIELLSDVTLTEEAHYEEVRRKSLRDFHKTHPSGSGTVTKTAPSAAKIKPSVTIEGTDDNNNKQDSRIKGSDEENESDDKNTQSNSEKGSDSEHETDENESGSESDQEENEEEDEDDEEEEEDEFVKTPSNDSDDKDEAKITDKAEGNEDEGMDFTTSQLYDDVDIRLNEPVQADDETISQVKEDAHVTLSTVPKKTEVPVTISSDSSDLAAKFLNFSDIPHTDAKIVSPMDVHVHHEVPSKQTPTLLTVPVSVITQSSPIYSTTIPQSLPSFTPSPQ